MQTSHSNVNKAVPPYFTESFDQFVILLKNTVNQMVYKHAISTVVPARSVSHHNNSNNSNQQNYQQEQQTDSNVEKAE